MDQEFNAIIVYADKNLTQPEICMLSISVIRQIKTLKTNQNGRPLEIHILGENPCNKNMKERIQLCLSINHDIRNIKIDWFENEKYETKTQYTESLIDDINWDFADEVIVLSLKNQLIKTKLIWRYIKDIIENTKNNKKETRIRIEGVQNKNSIKKFLSELLEMIKIVIHYKN